MISIQEQWKFDGKGEAQALDAEFREKYKFSMGHTKITCRWCGDEQLVPNEKLEAMRRYKCPNCQHSMSDREMARLKMHYYFLWWDMFDKGPFGTFRENFDYDIQLNPHYENQSE